MIIILSLNQRKYKDIDKDASFLISKRVAFLPWSNEVDYSNENKNLDVDPK